MFDELRFIRNEQVNNSLAITKFQDNMTSMNSKINQIVQVANAQTKFLKTLAYKSIDLEARSERIIWYFVDLFRTLLKTVLKLSKTFYTTD